EREDGARGYTVGAVCPERGRSRQPPLWMRSPHPAVPLMTDPHPVRSWHRQEVGQVGAGRRHDALTELDGFGRRVRVLRDDLVDDAAVAQVDGADPVQPG